MATIVTGLVQGNDLSVLRTALREAGHQPDDLQVLSPEDAESQGSSGIAGGDRLSDTAATGTGVPGLTRTQGRRDYFSGSSINDRLGEFEIPDNEMENYAEALDRGRSVVAYFARPDNVEAIEAAFRAANVVNVRRF